MLTREHYTVINKYNILKNKKTANDTILKYEQFKLLSMAKDFNLW